MDITTYWAAFAAKNISLDYVPVEEPVPLLMHCVRHIPIVLVLVQQGLGVLGGGSSWPLGLVIVEDGRVLALGLRAVRPELFAPAAAAWIGYRINLTFSPKCFYTTRHNFGTKLDLLQNWEWKVHGKVRNSDYLHLQCISRAYTKVYNPFWW